LLADFRAWSGGCLALRADAVRTDPVRRARTRHVSAATGTVVPHWAAYRQLGLSCKIERWRLHVPVSQYFLGAAGVKVFHVLYVFLSDSIYVIQNRSENNNFVLEESMNNEHVTM